MLINERITKSVSGVYAGYIIEITRTSDQYHLSITTLDTRQKGLRKDEMYNLVENIRKLIEAASKKGEN